MTKIVADIVLVSGSRFAVHEIVDETNTCVRFRGCPYTHAGRSSLLLNSGEFSIPWAQVDSIRWRTGKFTPCTTGVLVPDPDEILEELAGRMDEIEERVEWVEADVA